ncbi:MAG: gamma-butyrobetaine hydroxylase-like domain-containing protein [Rhizomicrobium sp.]
MREGNAASVPWPTELRVDRERTTLTLTFDTGERFALPAEYLRVESPSAEVQGHSASQKQIVPGKRHVKFESLDPVGNYATRIRFDDGHDTGLYSWDYLYQLGREQDSKWASYLSALRAKKLAR